jgi:hypothetical protein
MFPIPPSQAVDLLEISFFPFLAFVSLLEGVKEAPHRSRIVWTDNHLSPGLKGGNAEYEWRMEPDSLR